MMKNVLFVCVENSARSQMAEAFFNSLSKTSKASSAGTRPAPNVNPTAIEVMREVGIDISRSKPKLLTLEMIKAADKVITMGCISGSICPASIVETEDWGIEDPSGKGIEKFREVRDIIKRKVKILLENLEPERKSTVK